MLYSFLSSLKQDDFFQSPWGQHTGNIFPISHHIIPGLLAYSNICARSEHVTTMESHFYQCFGLARSYSCLYRTIKRLKRKFIIYICKNTFYPLCGFSIFTFLYGWGLKCFTVCCIPLLLYPEVIGSAWIVKGLLHFNRLFSISYSYIFLWNLAKPVDITY